MTGMPGMSNMTGMSKINNCFVPAQTIIDRTDTTNRGGVMHNNLGDRLLTEHVSEYKVNIDSKDRDISYHASPFKMKAYFGDQLRSPKIDKKFKNVKYVSLDYVILPRTLSVDVSYITSETPQLLPTDSPYRTDSTETPATSYTNLTTLSNHKYLILQIDEFSSEKKLGTSVLLDRNTYMLYYDGMMGMDNAMWKSYNNTYVFQNSLLGNISTLTFTFFDEYGNELKFVDQNGNNIMTSRLTGSADNYNEYIAHNTTDTTIYTNNVMQTTLCFTFGVVENELNTQTSY